MFRVIQTLPQVPDRLILRPNVIFLELLAVSFILGLIAPVCFVYTIFLSAIGASFHEIPIQVGDSTYSWI